MEIIDTQLKKGNTVGSSCSHNKNKGRKVTQLTYEWSRSVRNSFFCNNFTSIGIFVANTAIIAVGTRGYWQDRRCWLSGSFETKGVYLVDTWAGDTGTQG